MRIGFDVDGVLAEFCKAYEEVFVRQTGRNTFEPFEVNVGPRSWDWPTDLYGYTMEETTRVWNEIKSDPKFCKQLPPLPDMGRLADWLRGSFGQNQHKHDIYYITSRVGPYAKIGTEDWLMNQGVFLPTVLIVSGKTKGDVAAGLKLDLFVEDNKENAETVAMAGVPTYLIDRAYNRGDVKAGVIRVRDLSEVLPTII